MPVPVGTRPATVSSDVKDTPLVITSIKVELHSLGGACAQVAGPRFALDVVLARLLVVVAG